jgi:alpha-ribazole phosphatase CobZ
MPDKRDIFETLNKYGITEDAITDAAMELYVPHPGLETEKLARGVFKRELDFALSDPNLCILVYAATLLEEEGENDRLPGITAQEFKRDPVYLIADEVLGIAIAKYIGGYKGMFEFTRFDQNKPGILGKLGPFLDDAIAGLIGGVSSTMYSRSLQGV